MMLWIGTVFAGMSSSSLTGVMEVDVSDVIRNSPDEVEIAVLDGGDLGDISVLCKAASTGDLRCRMEDDSRTGYQIGPVGLNRDGSVEFDFYAGRDRGHVSIEPNPTPVGIAPIPSP